MLIYIRKKILNEIKFKLLIMMIRLYDCFYLELFFWYIICSICSIVLFVDVIISRENKIDC